MIQPNLNKVYILIGLYGSFAWLVVPNNIKRNSRYAVGYFISDWYLMFYFLPVLVIYLFFEFIGPIESNRYNAGFLRLIHLVNFRDQESAEFMLSLGFLFFVLKHNMGLSLTPGEQGENVNS